MIFPLTKFFNSFFTPPVKKHPPLLSIALYVDRDQTFKGLKRFPTSLQSELSQELGGRRKLIQAGNANSSAAIIFIFKLTFQEYCQPKPNPYLTYMYKEKNISNENKKRRQTFFWGAFLSSLKSPPQNRNLLLLWLEVDCFYWLVRLFHEWNCAGIIIFDRLLEIPSMQKQYANVENRLILDSPW